MAKAERGRDRERRQHVGGVETAEHQLVADVGPRSLAHQHNIETGGSRKAALGSGDQHGGVRQRHVADGELLHQNSSAAVMMAWAISTMRFFSFMAVRRNSA